MRRTDVISAARVLVGVPYQHGGRSRENGVDCVGLVVLVGLALKYPFTDTQGYSKHPDGKLLPRLLQFSDEIAITAALPGDIPVFWFDRGTKVPQHVAIFTETLGLIHAYQHVERVVEMPMERIWNKRLITVLRLRGLED